MRGGAHSLRNEPFHVGVDGAVVLGNDVPAWLRSPGSSSDFRVEQVGSRSEVGRPNQFFSCSDKSRDAGFCWRRFHFALLWFHPISFSIKLDSSTFRELTLGSLARGLLQDFAAFVVFCPKISRRVGPANLTI